MVDMNIPIKSDINYDVLKRGDPVLYARIIPNVGYYEILDTHIVNHYSDYCTVTESKTKQTFLINRHHAEDVLYTDRKQALSYLKRMKYENRNIKVAKE